MTPLALALALTVSVAEATGTVAVRVGSKAFTESIVLGDIVTGLVRSAGVAAEHRRALGGSRILWEALRRGEIDVYPDYTGTLAREILGRQVGAEATSLGAALAPLGIAVSASLGFEDRYAIGVRRAVAERLGLVRISDLAKHPGLRLGFTNEFMSRTDGWPALRERYGLSPASPRGLDHDVAYRAVRSGELDATDVLTTDPEVRQADLVLLEDDRHAFPRYQAVLVYRDDLARRAPRAVAAMLRLEGRISADDMTAMNASAQVDRVRPAAVTARFLRDRFGVAGAAPVEEWRRASCDERVSTWRSSPRRCSPRSRALSRSASGRRGTYGPGASSSASWGWRRPCPRSRSWSS